MHIHQVSGSQSSRLAVKFFDLFSTKLSVSLLKRSLYKKAIACQKTSKRIKQFDIPTRHGAVRVKKLGEGTPVWLIPSTYQANLEYLQLMDGLWKNGISSLTFDFPVIAGASNEYKLTAAVECLDDIAKELLMPATIVCHSIGTSILANSLFLNKYKGNITLVAPCFNYYSFLATAATKLGLSRSATVQFLTRSQSKEKKAFKKDNSAQFLAEIAHRVTLVHDKNDTVISISSSRRFAEDHRCELIETKNKGHYKNLVSKQLVREIQHKIF